MSPYVPISNPNSFPTLLPLPAPQFQSHSPHGVPPHPTLPYRPQTKTKILNTPMIAFKYRPRQISTPTPSHYVKMSANELSEYLILGAIMHI